MEHRRQRLGVSRSHSSQGMPLSVIANPSNHPFQSLYQVESRPPPPRRPASNSSSLTFAIAARDVAKLIGKGGASIKELRSKSQCQIEIGDESDDRGRHKEVEITVGGATDDVCKKAQAMVEDHLGYNTGFYSNNNVRMTVIQAQ